MKNGLLVINFNVIDCTNLLFIFNDIRGQNRGGARYDYSKKYFLIQLELK